MFMNKIIDQCYYKSVELLKKNATEYGVLACSPSIVAEKRNYLSIFGRDASICALGMIMTGDKKLLKIAKVSLLTLGKNIEENGQIPFYVKPEKKEIGFWYTISVDSTAWWLIAVKKYQEATKTNLKLDKKIESALNWLKCRENPIFGLIEQNEGSDWADIMPRSGYVLYTNALWYWVKELYEVSSKDKTKKYFNYLFDSSQELPISIKRKNSRFARLKSYTPKIKKFNNYLSFVNFSYYGTDVDLYGNILAYITGLMNKKQMDNFISYVIKKKGNEPILLRACLNPIKKNSSLWRKSMERHNQNYPDKYHNGGVWPFIGGFWVMSLFQSGKKELAMVELLKLAKTNRKGNWAFNEWFHGKTGRAMGKADQSWNAGTYIWAYCLLKK